MRSHWQNAWMFAVSAAVAAAVLVPVAAGQDTGPGAADSLTRLAGQVDLVRLVDLAAERLALNIEYDEPALKGTVTLRLGAGVTDAELWALVNQLLAVRGLTTVRTSGDTLSVVKAPDAAGLARVDQEVASPGAAQAGFATVAIRIEHRPVKEVAEALTAVLTKGMGRAVPLADTGILLVSDLQSRLEEAAAFVAMIDTPGTPVEIAQVDVRGMSAAQMVALATEVAGKRNAASGRTARGEIMAAPGGRSLLVVGTPDEVARWRDLIASLDQGQPVEVRTYSPRTFAAPDVAKLVEEAIKPAAEAGAVDERWRTVIDELTGSLIITATPDQHAQIRALVDRLDEVPAGGRRPVRSFVVRNRPVGEVLDVLQSLIGAGVLDQGGAAPGTTVPDAGAQVTQRPVLPPGTTPVLGNAGSAPQQSPTAAPDTAAEPVDSGTGSAATLTADLNTSTIIAAAEPLVLDQIERLIHQLDVRQPQVMLEVLLVSLTDGQTLDLGVELEKFVIGSDLQVRLASLFGLSQSDGQGGRRVGDPAGFTAVVMDPGDFSVVVRALQTVNGGRSLSRPRLLVNNNQQAVFNSVREEPFISTNASDTVATTSFGGSVNAGTTVSVRPQIAEADHLVLQYSISLSSFVGESSDPALPPPRQQNQVQSVATIPDGYTVVVGGLEATTEGEAVSQIPLLGDIPGLGELFKNRSKSQSRVRFFVFLRADVLRRFDLADLKYLGDRAAEEAVVNTGWPVLEPRVIR